MSSKNSPDKNLEKDHKKFAVECFNSAWDYLDKDKLNPDEEREMLNLAHASRFHWSKIGTARNFAIGDWQISRCYTKINDGISALKYAESCLQHTEESKGDLYVSAYEGMARAYAILKDYENARRFIVKAEKELEKVTNKDDRAIYEPQVTDTKNLIK